MAHFIAQHRWSDCLKNGHPVVSSCPETKGSEWPLSNTSKIIPGTAKDEKEEEKLVYQKINATGILRVCSNLNAKTKWVLTIYRIWVSQTAKELSYYEYPADSFNGECVANYYRPKKDESYDEKCIKKDQTLAKLPVICNTFGKFYLSSPIPRRSTSLPSWSRTIQRISQPLTSLIELQLNQKDGYWFQRLLQCTNGSCVQKLMLQLCHSEQCIKHIALALVIAEKSFEIPEAAVRHFLSSKRHFKTRLANISGKADLGTWELSLIATLLFTKFYIAIGRERSVRQCLKTGYVLIRSALRNFCYGSTYVDLPGYLPIMAIAFRRLEKAQNDLTTWHNSSTKQSSKDPIAHWYCGVVNPTYKGSGAAFATDTASDIHPEADQISQLLHCLLLVARLCQSFICRGGSHLVDCWWIKSSTLPPHDERWMSWPTTWSKMDFIYPSDIPLIHDSAFLSHIAHSGALYFILGSSVQMVMVVEMVM